MNMEKKPPHIPQARPAIQAGCTWGWALVAYGVLGLLWLWSKAAHAAESLPAVSPPTDWTGILVVCGFGLLLAAALAIGYAVHARRTPGMQWGEEQIEAIANAVHRKSMATVTLNIPPAVPLTFDGKTFASEEKLAEYKVAKAIIDGYNMEKSP